MNFSPSRVLALIRKESRQIMRDGSSLLIGLLLPAVLIFIFGYGLSLDLKEVPVALVNEDQSPAARDVLSVFRGTPYFAAREVCSMQEARELMRQREVDAIIRVRHDFSAELAQGKGGLQLILHGIDSTSASLAQSYTAAALGEWVTKMRDRGEQLPSVGAFLTALVMAREWERGTLEALFATPVQPLEVLISKIVPYFGIGIAGLALCLLAARFLFDLPFEGSFWLLVLSSMLYLLAALGLGLFISAKTRSQFLAGQVALMVSFLPAVLLSGFFFDLRNVPFIVRVIGNILPATYYMEILKTLLLAGDNMPVILKDCAVLALDAVIFLLAALRATRKRMA